MSLMKRLGGTYDKDIMEELATAKVVVNIEETIRIVEKVRKVTTSLNDSKQSEQYDLLIENLIQLKSKSITADKKRGVLTLYQDRASLLNAEVSKTIDRKINKPWWKL